MPLERGSSEEVRSRNIAELIRSGRPAKQAEAIAYRVSGEKRANDMSQEEWDEMVAGIVKFFKEEEREPEHAQDAGNWTESDHPRDNNGQFAAGTSGSISEHREEKDAIPGARETVEELFSKPVTASKENRHTQTESGVKKHPSSRISAEHLMEGFSPYKDARLYLVNGRHYNGEANPTKDNPLKLSDHEYVEAAKAHATRNLESIRGKAAERDSRFEAPARALGNVFSKHGYSVRLVHAGDSSSRYLYVSGENGTIKIRLADHSQPTEGGKVVGGFSSKTGKRHESSDYSIDPTTSHNAKGAEAFVKERLVPLRGAQDGIALDRASVREYDVDGRLHVQRTPISKANICEYWGREIPGAEQIGLQPDRKYRLLRHPDELRKGADTFNNLPLLRRHVPVSAGDPRQDDVVGATGTDAAFEHPYLTNSLVVWVKDDIDGIERDLKKELSCAYRYRADMTPGTYEGEPYDGIMRDLVGNHVALVTEGRAGPDVVVGDSAISPQKEWSMARATALSPQALLASGALLAYLPGKLAADAKLGDFRPLLKDVTAKNWKDSQAKIIAGVTELMKGNLAADAKLDELPKLLLALDEVDDLPEPGGEKGKGPAKDKKAKDCKAKDKKMSRDELKESLKEKMSAEDWKAACDDIDGMEAEDEKHDEDERPDPEKTNDRKAKDAEAEEKSKKAMDAALAGERQRQRDIREAERFVRPWVGDLAIAYDSAEEVYAAALEMRGKSTKSIHPSAFKSILEMLPKTGSENRASNTRVAMDSAKTKTFEEMFPGAMDIRLNA